MKGIWFWNDFWAENMIAADFLELSCSVATLRKTTTSISIFTYPTFDECLKIGYL